MHIKINCAINLLMGKNKKKSKRPLTETISAFKEIENYIKENDDHKKENFKAKNNKVKMPLKMYLGIKKAVLKKSNEERKFYKENNIIEQTKKEEKVMTKYFLDKAEHKKKEKEEKKLMISRRKNKKRFKNGTLNIGFNIRNKILSKN